MLPNHAPLVVAEQFSTLAALHPGRIDLGLGRAPGTDPATAAALRRGELDSADRFPDELAALLAHLGLTEGGGRRLATPPLEGPLPIWLLGSSGFSAELAGLIGLPFAFAHHFSAGGTVQALQLYRRSFRPSVVLDRPYAAIGVQVVCGEDDRHAQELARPSALSFIRLRQGVPSRMPTPQAAAEHRWTAQEQAFVLQRQAEQAVGGPETVRARLADLLERTGADELIVTTAAHDPADRARSLARTRELFGEAELPRGLDAA
jgi:luciferase family oxidoreductase group 1